jgi:hypothetical protein
MDANAPREGGSTKRTLGVAALVLSLVAVVAIASSGSAPTGGIDERRPSEGLMDSAVSVLLVLMAVGAVVSIVLLSFFGRYAGDGGGRARRSPRQTMIILLVSVAGISLAARLLADRRDRLGGIFGTSERDGGGSGAGPVPESGYEPEFALRPVLGITALVVVALAAWWLSARARRAADDPSPSTPAEALSDVLAATLDDLRSEVDPRRAVIGAYARMERSLAAVGLQRGPSEAPEEYVTRVLRDLPVSERGMARLTSLFAWARFSSHAVHPEMKDEAIGALEQVQRELEAAEAEREALDLLGRVA